MRTEFAGYVHLNLFMSFSNVFSSSQFDFHFHFNMYLKIELFTLVSSINKTKF